MIREETTKEEHEKTPKFNSKVKHSLLIFSSSNLCSFREGQTKFSCLMLVSHLTEERFNTKVQVGDNDIPLHLTEYLNLVMDLKRKR